MSKILSQSGISLADQYDVEGSIAGIEELVSREVHLVHEMGGVLFSERYGQTIRRMSVTVAQSLVFNVVLTDMPSPYSRILGVSIISDVAARLNRVQMSVRDDAAGREMPIISWDDSMGDLEIDVDIVDNDASVTDMVLMRPLGGNSALAPSMLSGSFAQTVSQVNAIAMRGKTKAFGAGTVLVVGLVHIAFASRAGVNSRGLPIPGW